MELVIGEKMSLNRNKINGSWQRFYSRDMPNATKTHESNTTMFIPYAKLCLKGFDVHFSTDEISIPLRLDHEMNPGS